MVSLRWIHENLEPPNCDEESSDIDDSCSDGSSYDSDLQPDEDDNNNESSRHASSCDNKWVDFLRPFSEKLLFHVERMDYTKNNGDRFDSWNNEHFFLFSKLFGKIQVFDDFFLNSIEQKACFFLTLKEKGKREKFTAPIVFRPPSPKQF